MDYSNFDLEQVLKDTGISYLQTNTHIILKECPHCHKANKVFVDKKNLKWICFYCYAKYVDGGGAGGGLSFLDDEDDSLKFAKGNIWGLLLNLGFTKHEIKKLLKYSSVEYFDDTFDFQSIPTGKESENTLLPASIIMPSGFFPLDCTKENITKYHEAYKYLKERLINNVDLILKFKLRYSPFHKRIIFPFIDSLGETIGWQGRDITNRYKKDHPKCPNNECGLKKIYYFVGEKKAPEYCPECNTLLEPSFYPKSFNSFNFDKKNFLYNSNNIDWSKPVSVVEGPFDCVLTYNSVALLGSSLTSYQFKVLFKNAKEVILYLDGDDVGTFATIKIYEQLSSFISVKIGIMGRDKDPGQYLLTKLLGILCFYFQD